MGRSIISYIYIYLLKERSSLCLPDLTLRFSRAQRGGGGGRFNERRGSRNKEFTENKNTRKADSSDISERLLIKVLPVEFLKAQFYLIEPSCSPASRFVPF